MHACTRRHRRDLRASTPGPAGGIVIQPKQAWTNVADFTARGLDAVNFGPGQTALAHHADERVAVASLVRAYDVLRRFLMHPIGEDPT